MTNWGRLVKFIGKKEKWHETISDFKEEKEKDEKNEEYNKIERHRIKWAT